jgi:hypothetical protein
MTGHDLEGFSGIDFQEAITKICPQARLPNKKQFISGTLGEKVIRKGFSSSCR